jgi:hypothetical protein
MRDITMPQHAANIEKLTEDWYEEGNTEKPDVWIDYREQPVKVGVMAVRPEDHWAIERHVSNRKGGGTTEHIMRVEVFFATGARTRSVFLTISRLL